MISTIKEVMHKGHKIAIILVVGLILGGALRLALPTADDGLLEIAPLEPGDENILVYIGASSCGWANDPELPDLVMEAKEIVRLRTIEEGRAFGTVGISRDRIVKNGLEHLSKFGYFDEISTGRGWVGMGMMKYVYGNFPGPAATPQVIVLGRTLHRLAGGQTAFVGEHVIVRKVGLEEIRDWVQAGAPM